MSFIYKILTDNEYSSFTETGVFQGSPLDQKDGYIHASFKEQVEKTRLKFFQSEHTIHILTLDPREVDIRHEKSPRSGEIYPHIYGELRRSQIVHVESISQ